MGLGRGGSCDPSLGAPLPRTLARIRLRRLDRLGSLQLRLLQGAAVAIVRKAGVALLPLDRIATLWTPSSDVGRVRHCRRPDRTQYETSLVRGNTRVLGKVPCGQGSRILRLPKPARELRLDYELGPGRRVRLRRAGPQQVLRALQRDEAGEKHVARRIWVRSLTK